VDSFTVNVWRHSSLEVAERFYAEPRKLLVELTAEAIVELFKGDVRARKELAELLVSEPDVRLAIINAVLRDVATKSDIEQLRSAMESRFEQHRAATKSDIEQLRSAMESRFEQHRAATKSDIEQLRADFRRDIEQLRSEFRRELEQLRTEFRREIDTLAREIDRLYKLVIVSVLGILISIANTILVRLLLPP